MSHCGVSHKDSLLSECIYIYFIFIDIFFFRESSGTLWQMSGTHLIMFRITGKGKGRGHYCKVFQETTCERNTLTTGINLQFASD